MHRSLKFVQQYPFFSEADLQAIYKEYRGGI